MPGKITPSGGFASTSKRADSIQSGPPVTYPLFWMTWYESSTSVRTVTLLAVNRPFGKKRIDPSGRAPETLDLIDATSKDGLDLSVLAWARSQFPFNATHA